MLQKTSQEFKTFFLLEFTKELIKNSISKDFKPIKRFPVLRKMPRQILRIPEPRLPLNVQYLKPTPTNIQINLGKLNPLIQDPVVKSIECNGPDEKIIVRTPQPKTTKIILNKQDIEQIIQTFSKTAKIPISEGIFKVAVGKLILSAIISEVIGSKFIIKKITYRY